MLAVLSDRAANTALKEYRMKNLIVLIAENLTQAETCVYNLRRQNFHAGLRGINVLSGQMMQIVSRMVEQAETLQEWGYDVDM